MKKLYLIFFIISYVYLNGLTERFDLLLTSGYTHTTMTGKSVNQYHRTGFRYTPGQGMHYGAGIIFTPQTDAFFITEGGIRYKETSYEIHRRHYYPFYRYHYRKHYYYDELRSSYFDVYAKFKPQLKAEMEIDRVLFSFYPYVGGTFSTLLESEDSNINSTNHALLFGADIVLNKKLYLGLEYSKGLNNVFKNGRAYSESFVGAVGIIF